MNSIEKTEEILKQIENLKVYFENYLNITKHEVIKNDVRKKISSLEESRKYYENKLSMMKRREFWELVGSLLAFLAAMLLVFLWFLLADDPIGLP